MIAALRRLPPGLQAALVLLALLALVVVAVFALGYVVARYWIAENLYHDFMPPKPEPESGS